MADVKIFVCIYTPVR